MTLLVAFGNQDTCVLLADRRTSHNGALVDDEYNKVTVLFCDDARVAIAFTGLATTKDLNMSEWVARTLSEQSNAGNKDLYPLLNAFRIELESLFAGLPGDHKLTVVVSGFTYWKPEPQLFFCRLTNFEAGPFTPRKFRLISWSALNNRLVEIAGAESALPASTIEKLESLVAGDVPVPSLVRFAVRHLRLASSNSRAARTIGECCNAAILPSARNSVVTTTYHSPKNADRAYGCNVVIRNALVSYGYELRATHVLSSGEIRKTDPCWCGSGVRYKECHAKKFGAVEVRTGVFKTPMNAVVYVELPAVASGSVYDVSSGYA